MEKTTEYLSVAEFAEAVGVSRQLIYDWLRDGHPKRGRIRRRYRVAAAEIPVEEVERLLAEVD